MSKWVWCDTHNHRYNEDDGCEYCYEIWKLISEFLKDLKDMRSLQYDPNKIDFYIKKWEEKLQ